MRKKIVGLCICLCLLLSFPLSASALTIPTLYSDLNNGTQFNNLFNYAIRYDDFYNSRYIAFRDSQNSYYLVWGDSDDFTAVDNQVTCSSVSYVRYWRQSTSSDWEYTYISNDTFSLSADRLVTTNLSGVQGFSSVQFEEWEFWTSIRRMFIASFSIFIALGIGLALRRR